MMDIFQQEMAFTSASNLLDLLARWILLSKKFLAPPTPISPTSMLTSLASWLSPRIDDNCPSFLQNDCKEMSSWHITRPQLEIWSCSFGDQLTGKGDQLTGGHGRHGWGTLDTMGEVARLRSTGGGCMSLESEYWKRIWSDDGQTNKWTNRQNFHL